MDSTLLHNFCDLFRGRLDAFGNEEGGCVRPTVPSETAWRDTAREHLWGDAPCGVYPMVRTEAGDHAVRWGCVDFDEGESKSWVYALNLHAVLGELGVTGWIERSRSKGYHVWVFSSDWVPAHSMRRGLLGVTQIAGAPLKEINPKSEHLGVDAEGVEKIGNYVRLPYPGWGDGDDIPTRRVVLTSTGLKLGLEQFLEDALALRTTAHQIESLTKFWEPPQRPQMAAPAAVNVSAAEIGTDLPPTNWMGRTANAVFRYGPFEGADRSSALWKLGCCLRDDGYKPNEVLALVVDADRRWGKHVARGDIEYLERMVTKVFAR
jgi:hypothetical protein